MSPLQKLRLFLQDDDVCRPASTQAGFAKAIGRSETLIRGIEKNRTPMSRKLARHIGCLMGVDEEWLLQYPVAPGPIPAAEGGELKFTTSLRYAIRPLRNTKKFNPKEFIRNTSEGQSNEAKDMESAPLDGENHNLNPSMSQMADHLIEKIRSELTGYCQDPSRDASNPFTELYDWLLERAEKQGESKPGPDTKSADSK